ncbi:UvrD-helicase domain-containing protein [Aquimarina sp. RZ0]|uniref:UvrD-helicase domain-containing protein n=1 Tax=Aquimarina sp. RZ0 TaxID=2607730 RepID=UPI0011F3BBE0|nr:UvrD-helicase domain-containing protein [Aquimarina sp. RZ0]KAA1246003.1 ATP-dependent helicase [Aquimarina sp. RZ0]
MDSKKITPLEKIVTCIKANENFVLQGGAGSGKTETLKQTLEFISKEYPNKKIACITHTNLAVAEIISRVGDQHTICTIHSFLNSLIKDYKKNIHQVLFNIFILKKVERKSLDFYENDEKQQKIEEHKNYKKKYEKYQGSLFSIKKESIEKVIGKREYDKSPEDYNTQLNDKIEKLNLEIKQSIAEQNFNGIKYNETRFDSFKELSFGHDSLLVIASLLFESYDLLSRITQDKYDFIFIDEYQDTNEKIIDVFLNKIPAKNKTIIGLFGDSMQGIYDDGIGDVKKQIKDKKLKKIEKEDNYRCSDQVVIFINKLRDDSLEQQIAFKRKDNGELETIDDRKGIVKLYYAIYDEIKPHSKSSYGDKSRYTDTLIKLIKSVENLTYKDLNICSKKLMLTNKSISIDVGFNNLYDVFNARYSDVKEEIEKDLIRLQFMDLLELCKAYEKKNYNYVLTELKKSNFALVHIDDKLKVKKGLDSVINSDKSAFEVLEYAFKIKMLKKSDSYSRYIKRKDDLLDQLKNDIDYQYFKKRKAEGYNTFAKMSKVKSDLEEEKFNELNNLNKKETFYENLFSDKIKFKEVYKYYGYLNEETDYITMHKTKGSGIENVLIVLDEYFWSKYDFKSIFDAATENNDKKLKTQKLFYVACSRAIKNLICVKLISEDEESNLTKMFPDFKKVNL